MRRDNLMFVVMLCVCVCVSVCVHVCMYVCVCVCVCVCGVGVCVWCGCGCLSWSSRVAVQYCLVEFSQVSCGNLLCFFLDDAGNNFAQGFSSGHETYILWDLLVSNQIVVV